MLDRKTIIGFVLMFLVFIGYMWYNSPSKEEREAQRKYQDSVYNAYQDSVLEAEAARLAAQQLEDSLALADTSAAQLAAEKQKSEAGLFACNLEGEPVNITVKNKVFTIGFNSRGAVVDSLTLADYTSYGNLPLNLVSPLDESLNLSFETKDHHVINTGKLVFTPFVNGKEVIADMEMELAENDSVIIAMRAYVKGDSAQVNTKSYLEFLYCVHGNSHEVDFNINFRGLDGVVSESPYIDLYWTDQLTRHEKFDEGSKGGKSSRNKDVENYNTTIYYKTLDDNADQLRDGSDDEKNVKTPLQWIAYKQQFFSAVLIADKEFVNAEMKRTTDDTVSDSRYLCTMSSCIGIPYQSKPNYGVGMKFYFGPNKYRILRNMDIGLDRILPLGWGFFAIQWVNRFAIIPVFNFLEQFNWNYGIIIIILTLLVKLVIFPFTYKSYSSSAVMKVLQPEISKLNEKYPRQEDAMKKQQAMSALYKKAGISPMAGCLPLLLQLPILYAMFRFFPASIELRQKPFLWTDDLSTFDSIIDLPFRIPLYGDHVSLFCLLMFAMQFFYTLYTMKQQTSQGVPGMKFMMYFMPFMMLFLFNSQSAALNFYYFLSLCITIVQMWIIRKTLNEEKIHKRMELASLKAKNKPQKKSRWQKRLEELQKQSEELQKQRNNAKR